MRHLFRFLTKSLYAQWWRLLLVLGTLILFILIPLRLGNDEYFDENREPKRVYCAPLFEENLYSTRSYELNTTETLMTNQDVEEYESFLPIILKGPIADQNTFYVAQDGDDVSGNGSRTMPWGTISYALEQVPDQSLILVQPGTYTGKISYNRLAEAGITLRSEVPYLANLENDGRVFEIFYGRGLIVEGFKISHIGPSVEELYLIQIQDADEEHLAGSNIILRNNIIHDSFNNDLIKVNHNASHVLIEGNIFYNQGGPEVDNHLDINSVDYVTVQDNIFFNDFMGSGRVDDNLGGHFIVVKDSNGDSDGHIGSNEITIRRNIFLNWQGEDGNSFIGLGDGANTEYYQAMNVLIENNLMIGNSPDKIHTTLKLISSKGITFRNNTVTGNLPANTYAIRTCIANQDYVNTEIHLFNNIWSDPSGTMGADSPWGNNDFSISPSGTILSFILGTNLYWNGNNPVPADHEDMINYLSDINPILSDPMLPQIPSNILLPRFDPNTGLIGGQFLSIRDAFIYLVQTYAFPASNSPVINHADPGNSPIDDILGFPRENGGPPDIGAVEIQN